MPKKAHAATVQLRVIEQPAPTPTYQTIFAAEPSPVQNTVHLSQWDDIAKQLPPHYSIPDVQIVELIRQYHPK
ncbi:hypothetical protein [Paenibacillus sp. UNC451MF]|uniref:hypothetical protein n=1 Tax=Paenibacillus sp. UNC451MF TaxID=1449063 RepID=UPI000AFB6862|nr:hypothetical protein [Paenibacillus sp. UNC451MF]